LTLVAIASASLASVGPSSLQEQKPMPVDDPEAYAVYASLVPNNWIVRVAHATRLVIQEETATYSRCMPSGTPMETTWKPVVDSYKAANDGVRLIRAGQPLGISYDVVPAEQIAEFFPKPISIDGFSIGWRQFHRTYPESRGYIQFSAVGFDSAKTRAMVYIGHHCNNLCGGGGHALLEKIDGAWRAAKIPGIEQCFWRS
jgi:hypothetical protein